MAASGAILSGQPTGEPKYSFATNVDYTWHDVANGNLVFTVNHAFRGASRCNRDSQLQGTCQISPNFVSGSSQLRTDARLDWTGVQRTIIGALRCMQTTFSTNATSPV